MSMVQGFDGNVVFTVTPDGTLTALSKPCSHINCPHGDGFSTGLVLASDGNFYGLANFGGLYN